MADRKYPIVLICTEISKGYFIGRDMTSRRTENIVEQIVHNDTEYNSFIDHHKNTDDLYGNSHYITERKATWKELDGNIFSRVYNWLPKWAVGGIAVIGTYIGSHIKEIFEFIKSFIHR